ncbi:MAG: RagB/SusD family nutrient uptake outer membrane protein [Cyclobacteriaceae bacterium]
MKNLRNLLLIICAVSVLACEDFIDLPPQSSPNVAAFYKNQQDIEQAVIAAYAALQSRGEYARNFLYFMEVRSDNSYVEDLTKAAGEEGNLDLFREATTNGYLETVWNVCYTGIQRCNIVLGRIDAIEMDEDLKNIRKGEVSFLRALTYFNLVRIWGKVPIVTDELVNVSEAFSHKRDSIDDVYALILADLEFAVDNLPSSQTDIGRVTKGAALTLLGKVYLTRQDWNLAATTLSQVQGYSLLQNYADVFDVENENNSESIFEVQFKSLSDGEGSLFLRLHTPLNNTTLLGGMGAGGVGDNLPTQDLFDAYDNTDLRKNVTIGSLSDGRLHTNKYNGLPADTNDEDNNFMVLRYADVILMRAEALNEVGYVADGEAFDLLNQIRNRAGLSSLSSAELTDQASFRDAVLNERRLELAFENHRWFDLVRTNRFVEVMNAYDETRAPMVVESHHRYFPVPQGQIDISPGNIYQNNGYE